MRLNADIQEHIEQEWGYFLYGIYGLCTNSGLPEHIAVKELAIIQINELSELKSPTNLELTQLKPAVNLLDESSALFAPHKMGYIVVILSANGGHPVKQINYGTE